MKLLFNGEITILFQHKKSFQYYINDYMTTLSLGNRKYNYENYIYSSWFVLYNAFSEIKEANLFSMENIHLILSELTTNLVPSKYLSDFSNYPICWMEIPAFD